VLYREHPVLKDESVTLLRVLSCPAPPDRQRHPLPHRRASATPAPAYRDADPRRHPGQPPRHCPHGPLRIACDVDAIAATICGPGVAQDHGSRDPSRPDRDRDMLESTSTCIVCSLDWRAACTADSSSARAAVLLARTVKDTASDNMSGCRQANVTPVWSASCSTI